MKDFDHLVYYLILYMYALTDFSTGKNHTVFDPEWPIYTRTNEKKKCLVKPKAML